MPPSEQTRRFRTLERRRMIRVKDALAAGAASKPPATEFMTACVDYLEFIIGRFLRQGEGNIERLREVVPESDTTSRRLLTDIENTLSSTRAQLQELTGARDRLRSGSDDAADFLTASQAFLAFYNQILAQRKDPVRDIIDKYLGAEVYWRQTDDVTPETIDTEASLFTKLETLVPDGVSLQEPD